VISKVTEALESGRRVTTDQLRLGAAQITARRDDSRRHFHPVLSSERTHSLGWLLAASLGVAGLLFTWFFFFDRTGFLPSRRVAEAVPTAKSVAVLPFESLSESKSDAYFADGVQDEILNNLAKIAQLRVISRTSVMQYRGDNKPDLRQIANALGVANVLEGTVRRDGNHVRVSTELVDARNDNMIWADSYDRDLTDIFAIQSEISQKVASRLSAQLSPEERKEMQEKPTNNLEAYDLYLQAKELVTNAGVFYFKNPRENLLTAIRFLDNATQIDSDYALAYCLLAKAHDFLYAGGFDKTPERRALGDAAVNEALRLRPDLPEAHLAMADHRLVCYRDYERARVQIAIAQRSLPNSPEALAIAADLDRRQSRWIESTARFEKAVTLDPRNPGFLSDLADNYFNLRRYRDCGRTYDRLIELEPDKPILALQKAFYSLNGNADLTSYRAALESIPSSMSDDISFVSSRLAYALAARDWTTAKEILSKDANAELYYFNPDAAVPVPRGSLEIWLAYLQQGRLTMDTRFAVARVQMSQKVEANPDDPSLLSVLALIDAALGWKEQAVEEAKRAVEMLPVSADGVDGPTLVYNLAADAPNRQLNSLQAGIKVKPMEHDSERDSVGLPQAIQKLTTAQMPSCIECIKSSKWKHSKLNNGEISSSATNGSMRLKAIWKG
jgi:TolB-like protein/Flp pilus assembly protein TadD